jgi:hypothetical protein
MGAINLELKPICCSLVLLFGAKRKVGSIHIKVHSKQDTRKFLQGFPLDQQYKIHRLHCTFIPV